MAGPPPVFGPPRLGPLPQFQDSRIAAAVEDGTPGSQDVPGEVVNLEEKEGENRDDDRGLEGVLAGDFPDFSQFNAASETDGAIGQFYSHRHVGKHRKR